MKAFFSSEAGGIETISNGEMKKAFGSWDTSASAWIACGTKECYALVPQAIQADALVSQPGLPVEPRNAMPDFIKSLGQIVT